MSFQTDHILVVIKADDCGHCRHFSEAYPYLGATLSGLNIKVGDIKVINVGSFQRPSLPAAEPSSLNPYLGFFPMIVMFSKADWTKAVKNPKEDTKMIGVVIGGTARLQDSGPGTSRVVVTQDVTKSVNFMNPSVFGNWIKSAAAALDGRRSSPTTHTTTPSFVPPSQHAPSYAASPSLSSYTPPTCSVDGAQFKPSIGRYY